MIALDTNVIIRYLVNDDPKQARAARTVLDGLTAERPGFICREVVLELSCVLEKAYGFSRHQVAMVLEGLSTTAELHVEVVDDVLRAADGYRRGGAGLSDRMIVAAAIRSGSDTLFTFDKKLARLPGAALL